jgi:hypothetical protein
VPDNKINTEEEKSNVLLRETHTNIQHVSFRGTSISVTFQSMPLAAV